MPADPFPPIDTARIRLRCVIPVDAEATSILMTEAISRWLASRPMLFTQEMATERIKLARESAMQGESLPYAILSKDDGCLIGWITLARDENDTRRGVLGYWLGEVDHGRGFARGALAALLTAGFGLLDFDVIEAGALPENASTLAVMRACGMTEAGERMIYAAARGREELCLLYEIRRPRTA